ncbi:MAG TPA: DUF2914 domain-containing protein [Gemmatimonadales bacterium]
MTRILSGVLVLAAAAALRPLAAQDSAAPKPTAPPAAAPAAGAPTIDAVLTRAVVNHLPQDTLTTAPADVGTLVLWTKVSGGAGQSIHEVWFHGDTQVGDVTLAIGGSPWRTWSRKTIPADWTGAWHVEVRDGAGAVLKRVDFTVGAATPAK